RGVFYPQISQIDADFKTEDRDSRSIQTLSSNCSVEPLEARSFRPNGANTTTRFHHFNTASSNLCLLCNLRIKLFRVFIALHLTQLPVIFAFALRMLQAANCTSATPA